MTKIIDIEKAVSLIKSGDTLMVGGFGLVGCPLSLLEKMEEADLKHLTVISNNLGEPGKGLGKLVLQKKVKKGIGSYFTSNPDVVNAYQQNELEIDLMPQGTLAESIRAGGAGIGGFYVKTGAGTKMSEGKEVREIKGETYLFQEALQADVALIKAKKADRYGNLVYLKSARNFNPVMATAASLVIAEVDEIVEPDDLSPEEIVTPHLYVDYLVVRGGDGNES
ncbi:CoA transferase subunit A [Salipaludibacillus aurantiacus]|uniref:3-oxoacid CoA-transferase subunit A n=1 Tax=Salipaludibacillus aurantiacus TaxID=1601833 RepID=A0A1H9UPM7_9BACI|nr:CoA transferase subunit A [Salipaludibacillus aurantiacus]SES11480.1 3-oxoacid CoA-transferase subunit A [Salipaludibacillus aurantiacus]